MLDFDHFEVGHALDIASWDSYPIGFLSNPFEVTPAHKNKYLQSGDPDMQAFHHDLNGAVGHAAPFGFIDLHCPLNGAFP